MVKIETFLFNTKKHKGNPDLLVNIKEYPLIDITQLDPDYLEGTLSIEYNGQVILDKTCWDLVDQLYIYFAEALLHYKKEGEAEFFFPDTPVTVKLQKKNKAYVSLQINEKQYALPIDEFASAIFYAAIEFFQNFLKLNPRYNGNFEIELKRIKEMEQAFFS